MRVSSSGYPISASTCSKWASNYGLQHPLLRDPGGTDGVAHRLQMSLYSILVLDRHLKIVYRGNMSQSSGQSGVLNALAGL